MRLDQGTRLFARLGHVNPIKNIPCFGVAGLTPFLVNGHPRSPRDVITGVDAVEAAFQTSVRIIKSWQNFSERARVLEKGMYSRFRINSARFM